jgi:hypothetical protein
MADDPKTREEKLAEALRENLRKRKAQARGMTANRPESPSRHPEESQDP